MKRMSVDVRFSSLLTIRGKYMVEVQFYNIDEPIKCKYVVMLAKYKGKYVLCRHVDRNTWEFPGGHIEQGENIDEAAKRELLEETGASNATFNKMAVYSVKNDKNIDYGMFYYVEIHSFDEKLHHEIEEINITDELSDNWTYPDIQPKLLEYYLNHQ